MSIKEDFKEVYERYETAQDIDEANERQEAVEQLRDDYKRLAESADEGCTALDIEKFFYKRYYEKRDMERTRQKASV